MKCFNHHERDAFGICRACGKALCLECMELVNDQVVCKNNPKCQEVPELVDYSYSLVKKQGFSKKRKFLMLFSGVAMIVAGAFCVEVPDVIMRALGCTFIFLGIIYLLNSFNMGKNLSKGK